MHSVAVCPYDARPRPSSGDMSLIYACRVHAQWGLIYAAEKAIPFALDMLKSPVAEAREDGAGILAAIGTNENAVDSLVKAFWDEYQATQGCNAGTVPLEVVDGIVVALGNLKNRKAIPALATVLRNPDADGDTKSIAVDSLGKIVRRRFDKKPEPLQAALEWLSKNGQGEQVPSRCQEELTPATREALARPGLDKPH